MSVKNLHSLLNDRWFIQEQYGQSLLPLLFSVLEGKSFAKENPSAHKPDPMYYVAEKSGNIVAVKDFSGSRQSDYVGIVNLKSPIYKYNQECGPAGTKTKMIQMNNLANDPNCLGVVLDVDSGGGQVSGTPEFHDFVKSFPKPVVSYTDGLMCSAAYYIGSAAKHVIANKRADAIGSIGVMVSFIDFTGYYEKLGAKVISEYSSLSTEKNRAFEELLKGKPEMYIKTELDPIAQDFINDIKSVRSNVNEEAFKGGTWNAADALAKNLIDEIGTLQDAVDKVYSLSNSSNSNKNNSKKKTMSKKTKSFPVLQKLIGVKGEGIDTIATLTGKKGVQVTEEQLGQIETELADKDKAVTTANGKVTTAQGKVTTLETAVNAAITAAGLDADVTETTTTEEKITLLSSKVVEYGKLSSGKGTTPAAEGDTADDDADDANSTSIYNSLIK